MENQDVTAVPSASDSSPADTSPPLDAARFIRAASIVRATRDELSRQGSTVDTAAALSVARSVVDMLPAAIGEDHASELARQLQLPSDTPQELSPTELRVVFAALDGWCGGFEGRFVLRVPDGFMPLYKVSSETVAKLVKEMAISPAPSPSPEEDSAPLSPLGYL